MEEAREFGEILCERIASERFPAQLKGGIAVEYVLAGVSVGDVSEEIIPDTAIDKNEVKRSHRVN